MKKSVLEIINILLILAVLILFLFAFVKTDNTYIYTSKESYIKNSITKLNKDFLLNLNTASKEEIRSLNGINSKLAQDIVKERSMNGYFSYIEDIIYVKGIGIKKFSEIRNHIRVDD